MKHAITTIAICLSLLVPGLTSAKKPQPPTEATCDLLLSPDRDLVSTGMPFTVKLVRVPTYPGAFRQPTISIDVSYPMPAGSEITQNETRNITAFNVSYVEMNFHVPPLDSGILVGQEVKIDATVTEPLRKAESKTTNCTTTASVTQGY
jgi:hypothetical protein